MKRILIFIAVISCSACTGMPVHSFGRTVQGSYDVETRYDMKTVAGMFSGFAGKWSKPDGAIESEIVGQVRSNYGANVADTFESVYGPKLESDIHDYLASEAPPWVLNLDASMSRVDKQLDTVDMESSWLIAEKADTGDLEATQIWSGFAVYKDPDCPDSEAIACEQLHVTSDELLDAEYPVEVVSSKYTAVDQGDTLSLDAHSVDFNYGRLGLYLLTNLILPDTREKGAGLRDVVLAAINYRNLAGRLAGDDDVYGIDVGDVTINVSLDDMIGNCEDGVFGMTNKFVDRFDVPLTMNLSGSTSIVDTNRDGSIDQLTGGNVDGDLELQTVAGDSKKGPVDGLFIGFRVGDVN